ncbi:pyridoxal phosphate-dependent transferase [Cladochytrium replicatum]|nr:pyridoxal phosphate-dependent transferase [Cladochytrium replicatum]
MSVPKLSSISASLPAFQIFGANTGVGKTIFSAALCRGGKHALLTDLERSLLIKSSKERKVHYLKPVQTGWPEDSDARHVVSFARPDSAETLFRYKQPASPHIAVRTDPAFAGVVPTDVDLVTTVHEYIERLKSRDPAVLFVEAAGGVNSPTMSGSLQADAYRPFRFPTVLVGDSNLGGISTTLSSYESLQMRGYDVPCIVLFDNAVYNNYTEIERNVDTQCKVFISPPPPEIVSSSDADAENLRKYYASLDPWSKDVAGHLLSWHESRLKRLDEMAKSGESSIWWPFTQHNATVGPTTVFDSAHGDWYTTYIPGSKTTALSAAGPSNDGKSILQFDACASWWTQGLGHGNPRLAQSAAYAAGRYGHVIFPECVHEPALGLTERLLRTVGKGWANRVYFSDDGSTALEVAFKMAFRTADIAFAQRDGEDASDYRSGDRKRNFEVIGLEGSYHGDTIGAMDAAYPNVYNKTVHWYSGKGLWFEPPTVSLKNGRYELSLPESFKIRSTQSDTAFTSQADVFKLARDSSALAQAYESHITSILTIALSQNRTFGALVLEPVLLGAGGMLFVDPLFQRTLVRVARAHSIPVIFDEVFVGFHRLGRWSASELLGVNPDISCFAKALTGGVVPLAVTLATEEVFKGFEGDSKVQALLHGHSYTAHPVGCAVACETIDMYEAMLAAKGAAIFECLWEAGVVEEVSRHPKVKGVVAIGTVLAVELESASAGYASTEAAELIRKLREQHNMYARPLGNVVYVIASHATTNEEARMVTGELCAALG